MAASAGIAAKRHAQAVFALALEDNQIDQWLEDLGRIRVVFDDPDITTLFEDPKISTGKKTQVLQDNLAELSTTALNLALLLVTKGRISLAPSIAEEFQMLVDTHKGVERIEVTTAISLGQTEIDRVSKMLSDAVGKQVRLSARVEPSIGGGLVVRIGDRIIDGSIQSKLQDLKRSLVTAG